MASDPSKDPSKNGTNGTNGTGPGDGPLEGDEPYLEALSQRFNQAIAARAQGDIDTAAELLRGILKLEPRLAEPRLELAHILLEAGQLQEAEDQAREALVTLEAGGRWSDDIDDAMILSLAWGTLGEALRSRADTDAVVFGPVETFQALIDEAQRCFDRALALDPQNEHAQHWSRSFAAQKSEKESLADEE
jgi:tetratricopeptide (TPR) repeat protein